MKTDGEEELPFIVSVWTGNGEGKQSFVGTGVLINGRTVLTCKHVARDAFQPVGGARHAAWVSHPSLSPEFPGWQASGRHCHETDDIAVITLSEDVANSHQTPYPWILTEVTRSKWEKLISSQHFSNCRIQGYPGSKNGSKSYTYHIKADQLGDSTEDTATGTVVEVKVIHRGIRDGMSGSPCLIQKGSDWYLLGMAYLGRTEATDSVLYLTPIITEFINGHNVEYRELPVCDFLAPSEEICKRQAEARQRLKNEVTEILRKSESLCQDLQIQLHQQNEVTADASPTHLADRICQLSVNSFVMVCVRLANLYRKQNQTTSSALLTDLYWTTLAATIDPGRVEECQRLLFSAASAGGVILIPSSDRTILELIMAGVDGRAAKLKFPESKQLPYSSNELSLDNIPESGVLPDLPEIHRTLSERLELRGWQSKHPSELTRKIRSFLKYRVDTHDRIFAVLKTWSSDLGGIVDRTGLKVLLDKEFPDLVWIDTVDESSPPAAYDFILNPLHDGLMQPTPQH